MRTRRKYVGFEDLCSLKVAETWRYFKGESFAYWMVCAYLFFEYVRPQSIYPTVDFLPWTQLAVIGAFIGCFFDKTVRWVSSPINLISISFFMIVFLSSVFAYFPAHSYERLDILYLWIIIYFLIINIVNSERRFFVFICIFLVASFKISLSLSILWAQRGFSFTAWGLAGPPGYFQNSGELSIQMLMYWPIAWAFVVSLKPFIGKKWYWFLMLMPITAVMVILGASSRGAQLALGIQLIVMNYRKIFNKKMFISLVVCGALVWLLVPSEQMERFQEIGEDKSSQQRLLYWENGLEMLNDNPWLGIGYFNYIPYYEKFYRDDMLYAIAQLPHNIFIQVGTDSGYIGLFLFVALIFRAFRMYRVFYRDGPEGSIIFSCMPRMLSISLVGFLVAGQFVSVAYYPFLWIHLALTVSFFNIYGRRSNFGSSSKRAKLVP